MKKEKENEGYQRTSFKYTSFYFINIKVVKISRLKILIPIIILQKYLQYRGLDKNF